MSKDLAAVCCFYNPCGFQSKIDNFVKFYNSLKLQLKRVEVVELCYNNSKISSLPKYVNPHIVTSNSVLWHKENLLNIGISNLIKEGWENIAWLDSDIIFENSFWIKDTVECLKRNNLCQIFSICEKNHKGYSTFHSGCVRSWLETGNILPTSQPYHTGYAWAAKSSLLSDCPLYDKAITGGGDSLMWLASFNLDKNFTEIIANHPITKLKTQEYILDYINWAENWAFLINNKIANIFCNIKTFYHGEAKHKQYISRYSILDKNLYNPTEDLNYNKEGVLETNKQNLNNSIKNYFSNRKEDNISLLNRFKNKLNQLQSKIDEIELENHLKNKL